MLFRCELPVQIDAQITDNAVGLNITRSDVEPLVYAMKFGEIRARPKPDRLGLVGIQLQSAQGTPLGDIRHTCAPGQTVSDRLSVGESADVIELLTML